MRSSRLAKDGACMTRRAETKRSWRFAAAMSTQRPSTRSIFTERFGPSSRRISSPRRTPSALAVSSEPNCALFRRHHQPEAEIRRAAVHLRFAATSHQVARAILSAAEKRSAPSDALSRARLVRIETGLGSTRAVRGDAGISKRAVVLRTIPVRAPLPDVAAYVMKTVGIGRERRHG